MASSDLLEQIGLMVNGLVIVIVNAVESYHLIKLGVRRKSHETLILSLSISDCFVGVGTFASELCVILLNHHQLITNKIKQSVEAPMWFSVYLSLFHIIAITVDRAIAVIYPTRHRRWVTLWRIKMFIIMIWLASTIITFVTVVHFHIIPLNFDSTFIAVRGIFGGFCLGIGILVALSYVFIIKRAIFDRKKTMKHLGRSTDHKKTEQQERRLLFITLAVVMSFIACMFPYSIEGIMGNKETYTAQFLLVSNSLINSIVYFYGRYLDKMNHHVRENANISCKSGHSSGL